MAIDAKISFMYQAEKRLATEITVSNMAKVMTIIADVLENFTMEETSSRDDLNEDLLDCYLDALKVQGRSDKTIERYRYIITKMMNQIGVSTRKITVYHLRNYLAEMQKRGVADTTTEGIRQVFSAYFNWLQRESLIEKNPTSNLGVIKCAKRKKKVFSDVDMENMNTNCKSLRDRAIIAFLASTGCRISEAMALNRKDLIFYDIGGTECVVHGKGNKERTVFVSDVAGMLLKKYLEGRTDDCDALFVNRYNQRMHPGGVREMMADLAKRAGVDHIHPHKFRRTLATELARHGMPIQDVARVLGHDKIDTTMKYIVPNIDDIKNNYRKFA